MRPPALLIFIGFLPLPGIARRMSVFSAQIENAASSVPSGKTTFGELYSKLTVGAAVFFVTLEIVVLVHAGWPPAGKPWLDAEHYVFGRDFINTWMGGRSIFSADPRHGLTSASTTRRSAG